MIFSSVKLLIITTPLSKRDNQNNAHLLKETMTIVKLKQIMKFVYLKDR